MRSPSARCLPNYVDLYKYTYPLDADSAVVGDDTAYPTAFATGVRCSIQPQPFERMTDQERISAKAVFLALFASNYGLAVNDRIVWVDPSANTTYKLVVTATRNLAGRASAWEVRCEERL